MQIRWNYKKSDNQLSFILHYIMEKVLDEQQLKWKGTEESLPDGADS